ncbi:MAG: aminopeptidase P family protein [Bacteroidetes bacterium]|jgi:Xaa-Pro dipeptidase|nr:aminopeptidase P family protein [Bacteroidota bacterium]MBT3749876.1 aminopeptidase P family protein [Bacteroidota bacterium]MBT4398410.1 aminopeptidase P family protein [Bacteroidota bacterium]MBT4411832.1 aminopeptidase P family protein [Bacteroidota bacterium]MBT7462742.1 aminopeptidase P family protein [Bacteroidota bacterium]
MSNRRAFLKSAGTAGLAVGFGAIQQPLIANSFHEMAVPEDLTADLPELSEADYKIRQDKARYWMRKFNIDAIFVEGGTNLSYFTDTSWWSSERLFGFILSPDNEPVWICPAFELKRAKEVIKYGTDIRIWEEHESPYALFNGVMKDLGVPGGKLGIGPNVRNFMSEGIRKVAKFELVNGAPVTERSRAVKTDKEIQYMDVANRITKLAYREGFANLREGMDTGDLGQIIRSAHSKYGASGGGGPLFGHTSAFPHGTRERKTLAEGDIILVDGGCSVKGYRSDVTRTIVYGEPNAKQREVWNVVKEAQDGAFDIIKAGLPCSEADKAARRVVEKAGYGKGYKNFAHRLGHGIGMEGHEYPYLVSSNGLEMETGMTFTNEPGIYLYGEFGVRIEDSFVVTENGYKNFGDMASVSIDKPFG